MTDVHAHLDDERFDEDRPQLIEALRRACVRRVITSGSNHASCRRALALAAEHDFIFASVGIYPHDTPELEAQGPGELRAMLRSRKVAAVGEIGLDYHYNDAPRDLQKKWFHAQLALAEELDLPVVIHCREAIRDTLDILREHPGNTGIFHCYSGSAESLREVLELGWSISMGGVVTFNNARVTKEVAAAVPADRLTLETDCPYLAPAPYRGKRNSPLYLPEICRTIAEIRGVTPKELERITDENAERIFFRKTL